MLQKREGEMKANRWNVAAKDHCEKKYVLIEVPFPTDDNVSPNEIEKLVWYKDLGYLRINELDCLKVCTKEIKDYECILE